MKKYFNCKLSALFVVSVCLVTFSFGGCIKHDDAIINKMSNSAGARCEAKRMISKDSLYGREARPVCKCDGSLVFEEVYRKR
jgi:hypothetical protein